MKATFKPPLTGINSSLLILLLVLASCQKAAVPNSLTPALNPVDNKSQADALLATGAVHTPEKMVFKGGEEGYHSYYAPSLVCTTSGVLVAICEGRANGNGDYSGNANIVCKRSLDSGKTWVSFQTVIGSGAGMWGSATSVFDPSIGTKGRIWVFVTYTDETIKDPDSIKVGQKPVYIYYNDNEAAPGSGWSRLTSVAQSAIVPTGTKADFVGPGAGIKQKFGIHAGRIIIPAKNRNIYSDDGGQTWSYYSLPSDVNEATIVELEDGKLMRNDRAKGGANGTWDLHPFRMVRRSDDNGIFSGALVDENLPDPKCEGSILRYSYTSGSNPGTIVFLNSASSAAGDRWTMRVRSSQDGGITWPHSRLLYDNLTHAQAKAQGKGGYSSMARTKDFAIGILVANASNTDSLQSASNHYSIVFHTINLPWINGE